jgi:hypothetical protein
VDADLVSLFSPTVASSGGQPFVLQDVEATGITSIVPGALGVFAFGDRVAPHNFFLDLDELFPRLDSFQPVSGGLPGAALPRGEPVGFISLPIGDIGFQYQDGAYLRSEDGNPFQVLDAVQGKGQVLSHDTVIILFVNERPAGYSDSNGVGVSTFDVIGGGDLLIFNGGEVVHGTWLRRAQNRPFEFFDGVGSVIGIPEGRVYMAIVPSDRTVEFRP